MALISTFTDDFSGTLGAWSVSGGVSIVSGAMQMQPTIPNGDYWPPAEAESSSSYELTDDEFIFELPQGPAGDAAVEHWFAARLRIDASNCVEFFMYNSGASTSLAARRQVSGTTTAVNTITYAPATHKWLKISHSSGTIRWWWSTDGTSWTEMGSGWSPSFAITALKIFFQYSGERTPSSAVRIDNINLPPVEFTDDVIVEYGAASATSMTLPPHQAGDHILIFAYRSGSTTAPSLATGFTNIASAGANTNSSRIGYKVAASSAETSGTWTNAGRIVCLILRGLDPTTPFGANSVGSGSGTAITFPALTLTGTTHRSKMVRFVGHRTAATITVPGAHERIIDQGTNPIALADSLGVQSGTVSSAAATASASSGWHARSLELVIAAHPKVATFTDDFSGTLAKWAHSGGVSIVDGKMNLQPTITAGNYSPAAIAATEDFFDLASSELIFEIPQFPPTATVEHFLTVALQRPGTTDWIDFYLYCGTSTRTLYARRVNGGTPTTIWSASLDTTNHRWLRISHDGTNVLWHASANGSTWGSALGSWAPNFGIKELEIYVTYNGERTPSAAAQIDNFNPSTSPANFDATLGDANAEGLSAEAVGTTAAGMEATLGEANAEGLAADATGLLSATMDATLGLATADGLAATVGAGSAGSFEATAGEATGVGLDASVIGISAADLDATLGLATAEGLVADMTSASSLGFFNAEVGDATASGYATTEFGPLATYTYGSPFVVRSVTQPIQFGADIGEATGDILDGEINGGTRIFTFGSPTVSRSVEIPIQFVATLGEASASGLPADVAGDERIFTFGSPLVTRAIDTPDQFEVTIGEASTEGLVASIRGGSPGNFESTLATATSEGLIAGIDGEIIITPEADFWATIAFADAQGLVADIKGNRVASFEPSIGEATSTGLPAEFAIEGAFDATAGEASGEGLPGEMRVTSGFSTATVGEAVGSGWDAEIVIPVDMKATVAEGVFSGFLAWMGGPMEERNITLDPEVPDSTFKSPSKPYSQLDKTIVDPEPMMDVELPETPLKVGEPRL